MNGIDLHGHMMTDTCEEIEPKSFLQLMPFPYEMPFQHWELKKIWFCDKCGAWKMENREYKGEQIKVASQKEYNCPKCNHTGHSILKMGGLICAECRLLLFTPNTTEWKEEFERVKK